MTNDEQPSLREIKRRQTLEAIEDSATALVLEHGFAGVTVDDICARAGISKRTFFNYVDSKDIAVIGPPPRVPDDRERADFLATPPESNVLDAVFELVLRILGPHDTSLSGARGEIMKRRKKIRNDNPELALQQFVGFHATRRELEELVATHLSRHPQAQRLEASPTDEAASIVTIVIVSVMQGSRVWHTMAEATQSDFRRCSRRALDNIFLLKGE